MLFRSAVVTADELARVTGWHVRPEGLCRDDRCVPFPRAGANAGHESSREEDLVDLAGVARAIGAALVHDAEHGLWALGPEAGGRALVSATAPDFELPDVDGKPFRLSSLRGQKVVLVAWASW